MRVHWAAVGAALVSLKSVASQDSQTYNPPEASAGTKATEQSILSTPSRTANPQYSNLLGNLLWFYEAQRSGKLPDDNRVPWRNDSLVDDGQQLAKVDLAGGYYDAGNFIKVTFPLSWTLQSVAWGASVYGLGYELTNQAKYLDGMLRWGYDWLIKASNTPNALWVQVGTTSGKDVYWGSDLNIPSPRAAFQVNDTHPGTDVFAGASAALAAGAFIYNGGVLPANSTSPGISANNTPLASIKNEGYATTLRDRAVSLWELATTAKPMQVYQKVVSQANGVYPSTDYLDELVLAGLWLALATGDKKYSDAAADYYDQLLNSPMSPNANGNLGGPVNWDQKSPATALLFVQAAKFNPQLAIDANRYQSDLDTYLDSLTSLKLSNTFLTPASSNSTGLLWFKGDSDASSLNPALNVAFVAQAFSGFAADAQKGDRYRRFGDLQIDYVLGRNPMNAVYVVGQHPNSAQNPHSSLASGGNSLDTIDTVPEQEAYVLYGAVVGGPSQSNLYYDKRSDYTQTEPALDTTAPMLTLTAARIQHQAWTSPPLSALNPAVGGPLGDPVYVALQPGTRVQPAYEVERSTGGGGISTSAQLAIGILVAIAFIFASGGLGWFFGDKSA